MRIESENIDRESFLIMNKLEKSENKRGFYYLVLPKRLQLLVTQTSEQNQDLSRKLPNFQ